MVVMNCIMGIRSTLRDTMTPSMLQFMKIVNPDTFHSSKRVLKI